MYTQTQKALSILLLTSMLLQSCGTNLMLGEQCSQMREQRQETQPAALETFPAATKPEYREGIHTASSQAQQPPSTAAKRRRPQARPAYTSPKAWEAHEQRQGRFSPERDGRLLGGMLRGSDDEGALEQKQSGPPPAESNAESKVELEDEDDDEKEEGKLQEHKEAPPASPGAASPRARRPSLVALQTRMAREDIQSTEALVEALNTARDSLEQQVLQRWILAYIEWFNHQPVGNLTLRPAMLDEYALLARIDPNTAQNRQLLHHFFDSLQGHLKQAFDGSRNVTPLVQALEYTLQHIDPALFEGNPTPLIRLCNDLLAMLEPTENSFTKATYPTFRSVLQTLLLALVAIQQIDPEKWDPTQPEGLYQRFRAQINRITQHAQYYPFLYHQALLEQSLLRLERPDATPQGLTPQAQWEQLLQRHQKTLSRVGHGLRGMVYLLRGFRALVALDPDIDSFEAAFEHMQKAWAEAPASQRPWYDQLQALTLTTLLTLEDATKYAHFFEGIQQLETAPVRAPAERKALQYGIITLLGELALYGPTPQVRQGSVAQLLTLSTYPTWRCDTELMEAILEALTTVAQQGIQRQNAVQAIEEILDAYPPQAPQKRGFFRASPVQGPAPQAAIVRWLSGQSSLEKLQALRMVSSVEETRGRLFSEVNASVNSFMWSPLAYGMTTPVAASPTVSPEIIAEQVAAALAATRQESAHAARQVSQEELRAFYQQPRFAQVVSFLEEEPPLPTSEVQCQLMALEKVKVKEKEEGEQKGKQEQAAEDQLKTRHERLEIRRTPVELTDLFKARSVIEGEPEQEVQRVLLTGEAGTGKTTLTKKLAYEWGLGTWGREFDAVYVLPIRELQQSQYNNSNYRREETLATAVVNNCFGSQQEAGFKQLQEQISKELQSPHTLVVLDGLDERYGASEKLISEALGGAHKLLLLSRPYGVEAERPQVDVEMEHGGLSGAQMQAYVAQHMSREEGERLWAFLQGQPALQQLSHVPVNLQILCALWKDDAPGVQAAAQGGNLLGLYQKLTEYIWRRHTQRPGNEGLGVVEREQLFALLGEVALRGLSRGEILISAETVREVAEALSGREELPRESGLLLQAAGRRYQFPHLTFQEYFAGRQLALGVLSAEGRARQAATQYLRDHKYKPQYGVMLSFAAGEVSRREGKEGLEKLLMVLGESASEVVGLQHLFLELRCVEAWLRQGGGPLGEAHQQRLTGWVEEALRQIKRDWQDTTLLEVLQGTFPSLGAVLRETPAVLRALVAAAGDSSESVRIAASEALGELAKAAPAHVEAVLTALLAAARDSDDPLGYVRRAASAALSELAKADPAKAEPVLEALIHAARDSDAWVRIAACKALGELVKADPAKAEPVLEALIHAARDSDDPLGGVRRAASEALGKLVKAAPQHAEAVLEALLAAASDSDRNVRSAASEALSELAKAAPSEAVRTALIHAVRDSDDPFGYVRRAASEALSELAKAAPSEAVRTALIHAVRDSDDPFGYVRRAASAALVELVKAAPAKAEPVLEALIHAARDSDAWVRSAASAALGELVKADPAKAEPVLEALIHAARDSDLFVRSDASAALGELVKAAPAR